MAILIQLGFLVLIVALALSLGYYSIQKRRQAWGELAQQTGLTLEQGGFFSATRLSGTYRGHELTLDTFTRGVGKHRKVYTRIVVFANNQAGVYLALYEEGVFSKIGKFFGREDIQIGDDEIDQRFIIKSRPETFASRLTTSISLRSKLLQAKSVNIEVDGNEVYYEKYGIETNAETLKYLFDLLIDLTEFVERGQGTMW